MAKKHVEFKVAPKTEEATEPKKLVIPQAQLDRLLRFEMEKRAHAATRAVAEQQRAILLVKLDPTGKLAQLDNAVQQEAALEQRALERFRTFAQELENQMGIKLNEYVIDDMTGELKKPETPNP